MAESTATKFSSSNQFRPLLALIIPHMRLFQHGSSMFCHNPDVSICCSVAGTSLCCC